MSLGIFSFDLEAFIAGISGYLEKSAAGSSAAVPTLEKIEETLQSLSSVETKFDELLMAAALSNTVTSVISTGDVKNETEKKTVPAFSSPPKSLPARAVSPGETARKELERMLKSLQTSVIHNYRDADIADEAVSLKRVANFPRRDDLRETDNRTDKIRDDKNREELRLAKLREDLRRERFRNNTDV